MQWCWRATARPTRRPRQCTSSALRRSGYEVQCAIGAPGTSACVAQYGRGACCVGRGRKGRHVAPGDDRAAWTLRSWRSADVGLVNLLESLNIATIDRAIGSTFHREQVVEATDADRGCESIQVAQ